MSKGLLQMQLAKAITCTKANPEC